MKQVLQSPSNTLVRDVPSPSCPSGNVLVRTAFSVISSGTERAVTEAAQRSLAGRVKDRPELALKAVNKLRQEGLRTTRDQIRQTMTDEVATGYSCAGTVIEVGTAVRGLAVGDRVACAGAGHASHAEVVSVPRNLCAEVPDGVAMESAALTTIASIALHGIRLAEVRLGDRVAVIGCGLLGQIACRLLVAAGATVVGLDLDPQRVAWAQESGAHDGFVVGPGAADAVRGATGGIGVDQVVITAAATTNDPLLLATEIARDRGHVVLVGVAQIDVPRAAFFEKELTFRVSRSYGPGRYDADYEQRGLDYPIGYVRWTEQRNMECILVLQAQGALQLRDLIDEVVAVDRAAEAYARLAGPPDGRPRGALAFGYADQALPRPPAVATPRPRRGTGAAVRVGLIGPGGFANGVLVPALSRAGAQLSAVAGGSGPSAESTARKGGFERATDSVEALIADESIDAVVVATRHGSHARLVRQCLEAGKHVFCEKPLALDAGELDGLLQAAERSGRVLMVGFNRRFAPQIEQMRAFLSPSAGPVTALYRVSAGRIPPGSWVHDLEEGGGRIIGEGCHFFDTLVHLVSSEIRAVHTSGFAPAREQPAQAHDNVVITADFANGSVGSVAYVSTGAAGVPKERLEAFAGDRTAILDDYRELALYGGAKPERHRLREQDKGHDAEIARFLSGVRDGSSPITLAEIRNVHLACFAAVDSLRTAAPVALPA